MQYQRSILSVMALKSTIFKAALSISDIDRGYYRDGRFWRNHGEWRRNQNRDYRYDRRW